MGGFRVLASKLPPDISPARRLREYLTLVRDLSLAKDPHEMIQSYRTRAQFVVASDGILSLSRRDMPAGLLRITRSTRWTEDINPWREVRRLPVVDRGLLRTLLEGGLPVKMDELDVDPDDPFAPYAEGMNSLLAAPIFHEGKPEYMVVLLRKEPGSFTLDELSTIVLTSNLIGRSTSTLVMAEELRAANAALDREFRIVGEIQRELLPRKLPQIAGVSIATHYETSTRAGGDYYDFFELPDGRWSFLIADVSGHGPPAAVVVAMMHAFASAQLRGGAPLGATPIELMRALNRDLCRSISSGQFVTAFGGLFDPRDRTLRYCNAGHNPPRLLRGASGSVIELGDAGGIPLAISEDAEYGEGRIEFGPGDRLVLYTDGITETFNARREMWGTDGLDATLHCCSRTAAGLIEAINTSLSEFSGGAPASDDRTLVVLAFE